MFNNDQIEIGIDQIKSILIVFGIILTAILLAQTAIMVDNYAMNLEYFNNYLQQNGG